MIINNTIAQAVNILKQGGIIAYPTEAVFGLGCDPFNKKAVLKLLALKKREVKKGLILITATWEQVRHLTTANAPPSESAAPITWIFPASKHAPTWICGEHKTLALRLINHPTAKQICLKFGGPIVSTSANIEGQSPARSKNEVLQQFPAGIDLIVDGVTGGCKNPSEIRDASTGKIIRSG